MNAAARSTVARSVTVLAVLALASYAAARLTPRHELGGALRLAELIPERFGSWAAEPDAGAQVLLVPNGAYETAAAQDASYDDVLMRTYRRADGARVMVAIAYGRRQTQEIKIHRPELCYYAQGFEVRALGSRAVQLDDARSVESLALLTHNRARTEVVTYWIRVGGELASNPWAMRWTIFREGLGGRVPDGVLVRASSLAQSADEAERELALQHEFLADLYREVPPATRRFLAGAPGSVS
jgi:EpsI family protein